MKSCVTRLELQSVAQTELIDITERVNDAVEQASVTNGVVHVVTQHTTTAITVNEGLWCLERDLQTRLERLVPEGDEYRHARFLHSDGQMAVNAWAHLRGALLGMHTLFPIADGHALLGARQRIYFVELDGPQQRICLIHMMGE
jgi:secondary thiamine-phosphate synthase enzyme